MNTNSLSHKAIVYARVSTKMQSKEGYSLEQQVFRCKNLAYQMGFEDDQILVFQDAISGSTLDRPGLTQARELLSQGVKTFIVWSIDRLSRDFGNQILLRTEFNLLGVAVWYADSGDKSLATPQGELLENMQGMIASFERSQILGRTAQGMRAKVEVNKAYGGKGQPPFGYRKVGTKKDTTLEIIEEDAAVVRRIYEMYLSGISAHSIAMELSRMAYPTPSDRSNKATPQKLLRSGQWTKDHITRVIRNPTYKGAAANYRYQSVVIPSSKKKRLIQTDPSNWVMVPVPAIVSEEVWEAAQEKMNKGQKNAFKNTKNEYLLGRRIRCQCGYCITASVDTNNRKGKVYVYRLYKCNGRSKTSYRSCNLPIIKAPEIEDLVWGWIVTVLQDPEEVEKDLRIRQQRTGERHEDLLHQRTTFSTQLENITEQYRKLLRAEMLGEYPDDVIAEEKATIANLKSYLEEELARVEEAINAVPGEHEIITARGLAELVRQGVEVAGESFKAREKLINILNVQVTVGWDGEKSFSVTIDSVLSSNTLPLMITQYKRWKRLDIDTKNIAASEITEEDDEEEDDGGSQGGSGGAGVSNIAVASLP
jgi:site-specific DNA recombinase